MKRISILLFSVLFSITAANAQGKSIKDFIDYHKKFKKQAESLPITMNGFLSNIRTSIIMMTSLAGKVSITTPSMISVMKIVRIISTRFLIITIRNMKNIQDMMWQIQNHIILLTR